MKGSALLFSLCLGVAAQSALADEPPTPAAPPQGGEVRGACKADIEKLCPGIQPGGGKIRECMKQHEADLSDACKQALAKARSSHS
jgi:Cysteine rich repeat